MEKLKNLFSKSQDIVPGRAAKKRRTQRITKKRGTYHEEKKLEKEKEKEKEIEDEEIEEYSLNEERGMLDDTFIK